MWNKSVFVELRDFGKNIQMVAIFMLVSLIPAVSPISMILYLVFMYNALKNIKIINFSLNDSNLENYRSKMLSAITKGFIAIFCFIPGGIFLAIGFLTPLPNVEITVIIAAILLLLGFIVMISSFATERNAWKNLGYFFKENNKILPERLKRDAIDGANNLETAALLYGLFIFGITIIIGYILRIIGYFKLAKLNGLIIPVQNQVIETQIATSAPTTSKLILEKSEIVNFCPICGAKTTIEGIYCSECGSKIK